ncbi:MAG: hypothetical protein JNM84_10645 [Planctomycetes bacterium]|nr:hypothetical protein [Planctomycetota bacterium]
MNTVSEVEEYLRDMRFSVPVERWQVEFGEDHMGYPAAWVWATLEPKHLDGNTRHEVREGVRAALMRHRDLGIEWVYVRFRAVGEEEGS